MEDAREVVRLVRAEAEAARLHQTIARYADIARALGPEGVRAKMLAAGLTKLNAGLGVIAKAAAWPLTAVGDNGGIAIADRPIALCSESERWRAQSAIQLTLGAITGSKVVVLDRGDLLDASNRAGLVKAVSRVVGKTGMAVLLCSTGMAVSDAPLAAGGNPEREDGIMAEQNLESWQVQGSWIYTDNGCVVMVIANEPEKHLEAIADTVAKVAAAPEMLEALECLIKEYEPLLLAELEGTGDDMTVEEDLLIGRAKAAIAKAKGETRNGRTE